MWQNVFTTRSVFISLISLARADARASSFFTKIIQFLPRRTKKSAAHFARGIRLNQSISLERAIISLVCVCVCVCTVGFHQGAPQDAHHRLIAPVRQQQQQKHSRRMDTDAPWRLHLIRLRLTLRPLTHTHTRTIAVPGSQAKMTFEFIVIAVVVANEDASSEADNNTFVEHRLTPSRQTLSVCVCRWKNLARS